MHPLEEEIIKKIRHGDRYAFEYLFKTYYSLLCNYAFDLIKDEEAAKEAVQEILIKIWENRLSLNITTSIKSYLYRSVHNHCINFLKHLQTVKNLQEKYNEDVIVNAQLAQLTEEEFTLADYFYEGMEKDLENAIDSLPEQCRIIFRLSRFDHLKHDQISKSLNLSVNTVKTQIGRALEKIRNIIGKKIEENIRDSEL